MRRTPLRRTTPLRGKAAPKRTEWQRKPRKKPDVPKATREFVLRRDGGCVLSDKTCWGGIHIHHVLPRARGGQHDAGNLKCLCAYHHAWAHGHPNEAKALGVLL